MSNIAKFGVIEDVLKGLISLLMDESKNKHPIPRDMMLTTFKENDNRKQLLNLEVNLTEIKSKHKK